MAPMCCFSQPVHHVSGTRIFAREMGYARQCLVYQMTLSASSEMAMVLPVPVPVNSPEDAVSFVDLSGYPTLFSDMERAFVPPLARGGAVFGDLLLAPQSLPLVVHEVGNFEASFVPTRADFRRLDRRFVLPDSTWDGAPALHDYGFVVFKLKGLAASPGESADAPERPGFCSRLFGKTSKAGAAQPRPSMTNFHPMAFVFARRDPSELFFPTLHVHDGKVHRQADFDHALFFQGKPAEPEFEASDRPAQLYLDASKTEGLVDGAAILHKIEIRGRAPNQDTRVRLG